LGIAFSYLQQKKMWFKLSPLGFGQRLIGTPAASTVLTGSASCQHWVADGAICED
jgi:hypothetical protein